MFKKPLKSIAAFIACLFICGYSYSQADDIMFVEYVDWNSGNGFGVKIYNPTSSTINLSAYTLNVYNNGNTSPSGSYNLSGTIAAGAVKILGNSSYCNTCSSTCDLTNSSSGVNSNDVVALLKSGNFVDMIGLVGYNPGSAGWRVGGVSNAHLWHRMTRDANNCTRYTSTSGSGANSWPNSSNTNHPGWTVSSVSCLTGGFTLNVSTSAPKINIPANDTVVCEGTQINFTADGSYKWLLKNANGATILNNNATSLAITFPQNGTDTILVESSSCGVLVYDTLLVKVGAPITFDFGPDATYCGNINKLLDPAITGATYLWQDNSTVSTFTATAAGTYWAQATRDNCKAADTIVLSQQSAMTFSLGADTSICQGDSVIKSYNCSGCTYLWSTNETTSSITIKQSNTYWLEVTNATCKVRDTVIVTVTPLPSVSLGADVTACGGDSAVKSFTCGGCNYLWSTNDISSSITIKQSGSYWLQVNNGGCKNSDTVNVTFNTLPVVSLGADTSSCVGDSVIKSYSCAGCTYLWSTNEVSSSIAIKQDGNYWLQVNDGGCMNSDTVNITFNTLPAFSLGGDTAICAGDSVIKAYSCAGCTYLWSTNEVTPAITIKQNGNYWLQVENAGCKNSDTIIVSQTPLPIFSLGPDTVLCPGIPIILNVPLTTSQKIWKDNSTADTLVVGTTGIYWARATQNGCSYTDSIIVGTVPTPPKALKDTSVCQGQTLVLDAAVTGATYLWDDNSTQNTRLVNGPGTYRVDLNLNNCTFKDSALVKQDSLPVKPQINDTTVCENALVILNATSVGATSYLWNTGAATSAITLDSGGVYIVMAINSCGNTSDTAIVNVDNCDPPYIPNVFTPNEDGLNDGFSIDFKNARVFRIEIYNRWGERVFDSNDPAFVWRGNYRGEKVPAGVYFFVLSSQTGIAKIYNVSGTITLIR